MIATWAKIFANLWILWLAALLAVTWFKLWKAQSSITDIVRSEPNREMRAERLQNVAVFLFLLGGYAISALRTPLDLKNPSLPDVSATLLAVLTGSNGIYLVKKALDARPTPPGPGQTA
jgi:hypothetical protein